MESALIWLPTGARFCIPGAKVSLLRVAYSSQALGSVRILTFGRRIAFPGIHLGSRFGVHALFPL